MKGRGWVLESSTKWLSSMLMVNKWPKIARLEIKKTSKKKRCLMILLGFNTCLSSEKCSRSNKRTTVWKIDLKTWLVKTLNTWLLKRKHKESISKPQIRATRWLWLTFSRSICAFLRWYLTLRSTVFSRVVRRSPSTKLQLTKLIRKMTTFQRV